MKLKTTGLTKIYPNGSTGVNNINMEVEPGEFIVILGPSGCGKSTLLRLICGLEAQTSGTIYIDDSDITDWEPKKRDTAMVFQNYALYPHMNVRQNLEFGLKSRKIEGPERDSLISWASEILGLKDLLLRKPRELSGGQRKRVALGRAIVRKPKIYLYDEPLSNLDAELRMKMRGEILALHKRVNGTSIYVTHDQVEAMSLAGRIYILKHGEIVSSGTPSALYDRPPDLFTAGFLGFPAMNLLRGKLSGDSFTCEKGMKIPIESPTKFTGDSQREATLGVRPDDIVIGGNGGVRGKIISLENLGRSVLLFVELEKGEMIRIQAQGDFAIGDMVSVSLQAGKIFLYDVNGNLII